MKSKDAKASLKKAASNSDLNQYMSPKSEQLKKQTPYLSNALGAFTGDE